MTNSDAQQQRRAEASAEEILRAIYGDDLEGCAVRPGAISPIILAVLKEAAEERRQVLELYEKAVEAFDLLSAPPALEEIPTPEQLRSLLSERLDKIHALAKRLIETTTAIKTQQEAEP